MKSNMRRAFSAFSEDICNRPSTGDDLVWSLLLRELFVHFILYYLFSHVFLRASFVDNIFYNSMSLHSLRFPSSPAQVGSTFQSFLARAMCLIQCAWVV